MANIALDSDRTAAPLKIRINRRGWAVLVGIPVFVLTIVAAFWVTMLTSNAKASDELPLGTQTVAVTVIPGDSLWSLAGEFAPDYEVSAAIEHIVEINNLPSSEIHVGDTLQIPLLAR